ncbi:hypothetical protein ACFL2Q_01125 [Thermodesulfobacteriota bacterium]
MARRYMELRDSRNIGVSPGQRMLPMPRLIGNFHPYQFAFEQAYAELAGAETDRIRRIDRARFLKSEMLQMNRSGMRLGLSIIRARPGIHVLYYAKALIFCISLSIYADGIALVLLMLLLIAHTLFTLYNRGRPVLEAAFADLGQDLSHLNGILIFSLSFFLAKLVTVILVVHPEGRYHLASALFLAGAVAATLFVRIKIGLFRSAGS